MESYQTLTETAITLGTARRLYNWRIRFVLCGSVKAEPPSKAYPKGREETPESQRGKIPLAGTQWLQKRPTPEEVIAHLNAPVSDDNSTNYRGDNRVGFVPGSVRLTAIDLDNPEVCNREQLAEALGGSALGWIPSRHGGEDRGHAYYPAPRMPEDGKLANVGNWQWGDKPKAGELRGNKGHVVLWNDAASKLLKILDERKWIHDPHQVKLDLSKLPGLPPRYHKLTPANPDAPSGAAAVPANKGRTTQRSAKVLSTITPLPDDEINNLRLSSGTLDAAFAETRGFPSPSEYCASIAMAMARFNIVDGLDLFTPDYITRGVKAYRVSYAKEGAGADYKSDDWISDDVQRAFDTILEQRKGEAQDDADFHAEAESDNLADAPELSKERRAVLFRLDPILEKTVKGTKQGPRKSLPETDLDIAKRSFALDATPREVVGMLKFTYSNREDQPDPEPEYLADTTRTALAEVPVTRGALKRASSAGEALGIPEMELGALTNPDVKTPPTYIFITTRGGVEDAVVIGSLTDLSSQTKFRLVANLAYSRMPRSAKPAMFLEIVGQLMRDAREIPPEHPLYVIDFGEQDDLSETLESYLDFHTIGDLSAEAAELYGKNGKDSKEPFLHEGRRALSLVHYVNWGKSNGAELTQPKAREHLKTLGWLQDNAWLTPANRQRIWVEPRG